MNRRGALVFVLDAESCCPLNRRLVVKRMRRDVLVAEVARVLIMYNVRAFLESMAKICRQL